MSNKEQPAPHHWRRQYWENLENYEKDIISLWHRPGGDVLRDLITKAAPQGKVVADIGCGPGNFLPMLKDATRIYAIDFSKNMLAKARQQAPKKTQFLNQDMRSLALPEKVDLAICFNAIMPENHTEALIILKNVLNTVKPGGVLILVVPSFESRLYSVNMWHFQSAKIGREEEHLHERLDAFVEYFNNPLGYVLTRGDVVTRYWLEREIHSLTTHLRPEVKTETFMVNMLWPDSGYEQLPWGKDIQPPWFWGAKVVFPST